MSWDLTIFELGMLATAFLIAINIVAFGLFGVDKAGARHGIERISEKHLISVALLGGSVGAKLGQRAFRHKIKRQPFAQSLNLIIALHSLLLITAHVVVTGDDQLRKALWTLGPVVEVQPEKVLPRRFGPGS